MLGRFFNMQARGNFARNPLRLYAVVLYAEFRFYFPNIFHVLWKMNEEYIMSRFNMFLLYIQLYQHRP